MAQSARGPVEGYKTGDGIYVFLGIPYAKPPVGELRFAAPQQAGSWIDKKAAWEFGPACPQPLDEYEPASLNRQSEDCLTLNIWTPGLDGSKRPVLVDIHHGGFTAGGSSE